MLEITDYTLSDNFFVKLKGRIDGITQSDVDKYLLDVLKKGVRTIILDFQEVNYLSSAGLRVLLVNQQKISKAGGELIIYKLPESQKDVFKLSGFAKIFKIIGDDNELPGSQLLQSDFEKRKTVEKDNLKFELIQKKGKEGNLKIIGSTGKLQTSDYESNDSVSFDPSEIKFACGLSAMGFEWEDFKDYFGESFVLNHSIYFYPAIKQPAVDYMIYSSDIQGIKYNFLNGFSFDGEYSYIISFEAYQKPVEISSLMKHIAEITGYNLFGFVFIAESKGIRAMNIKKIPVKENKHENGKDIFDNSNFADWINFPVEHIDINNIAAGVGVYADETAKSNNDLKQIFSGESNSHFHCGIFEKSLLSFKPDNFESDLNRVMNELQSNKVQHILSDSVFSFGTLAIIKLKV